jgi:hypothetical protein
MFRMLNRNGLLGGSVQTWYLVNSDYGPWLRIGCLNAGKVSGSLAMEQVIAQELYIGTFAPFSIEEGRNCLLIPTTFKFECILLSSGILTLSA